MIARCRLVLWLSFGLFVAGTPFLSAADPALPDQFVLPKMKTSIYVGSVTLITSAFTLADDTYHATYEAKVSPWTFWNEAGAITLDVTPDNYERLSRGETIEITGEAKNGKGKRRTISARAQPTDATTGRIKVRITASGTTLIFNSTYVVNEETALAGSR